MTSMRERSGTLALLDEVRASVRLPTPQEAKRIRKAAHVTQERLAEALGVHRVSVARWEAGEREPQGELRAVYATVLRELEAVVASERVAS